MIDKLIEGNIQNNVECLRNVENLLSTLYAAWKDVVENPRADGIPSKRLQPEEYKEYMARNEGADSDQANANQKQGTDNQKLKVLA